MLLWVFVILTGLFAGIALHLMGELKKANNPKEDPVIKLFREFYDWGGRTRVVVRDKKSHLFVSDVRVLDLFTMFRYGQKFRDAKMLWQNDEFKVFVQEKGE